MLVLLTRWSGNMAVLHYMVILTIMHVACSHHLYIFMEMKQGSNVMTVTAYVDDHLILTFNDASRAVKWMVDSSYASRLNGSSDIIASLRNHVNITKQFMKGVQGMAYMSVVYNRGVMAFSLHIWISFFIRSCRCLLWLHGRLDWRTRVHDI